MRYTRWVGYKECQWGQLDELQMDEIAFQRYILVEENRQEATEGGRRALNIRLLEEIADGKWRERTQDADTCKRPLLNYQEWGTIEQGLYREERVRDAIGGQGNEGGVPRWDCWDQMNTQEQRRRLKELSVFPRRQPVREFTEELGVPQTEEEDGGSSRDGRGNNR